METSRGEVARFQYSSDQSLLVYFDEHVEQKKTGGAKAPPGQSRITLRANKNVRRLLRLLELEPVPAVRNLHPAYCSLLITFDAIGMRHQELEAILRKRVPAGSVGIAGNQTGVYPFATPGGWRLLGCTPFKMFRADSDGLSLLSIGDRVRFTPISRERFATLESA